MDNFDELGLSPELMRAIEEVGYTRPTPIQEQAIPAILMTRDLVGVAQTGTGKTAGFILPMIEILMNGRAKARMPRSIVMAPTRELAAQVAENFDLYGKYAGLAKALLVGGESMGEQIKTLERGADVLIATPGRLLDLFERGQILLSDIRILVIDEADRMLDMGFIPDIEKIISKLPQTRQTLLFSATMPPEIQKLAEKFLSSPKKVSVAPPSSPAERVNQRLVMCPPRGKRDALKALLRQEDIKNAFVFCNTKREVDSLGKWLQKAGENARMLHGDMDQTDRTATLRAFKDGEVKLLVCSDVAARGLDIDQVSHVFNYDLPRNPEDYIHRIGRTGRAGHSGEAWSLATGEDDKYIEAVEKLMGKTVARVEVNGVSAREQDRDDEGSGGGSRSRGPQRDSGSGRRGRGRDEGKGRTHDRAPKRESGKTEDRRRSRSRERDDDGPDRFTEDNMPAFLKQG